MSYSEANETDKIFFINIDEESKSIQVKTNQDCNADVLAEGHFAFDEPGHALLTTFEYVNILPDDHQQLSRFLSTVTLHLGRLFKSLVCLRLPITFDNRIDLTKVDYKNISNCMSVKNDNLKYYPDQNIQTKQQEYDLIVDQQLILDYAEPVFNILKREAYWCATLTVDEMRKRINSSALVAMILDKVHNRPCGFGRLFLLKTNSQLFGYLSDVAIDSFYQSKGLGTILINYFVGTFLKQHSQLKPSAYTLFLQYAYKGSGAIAAPKIYRRVGLEDLVDLGNRIAIFANKDFR